MSKHKSALPRHRHSTGWAQIIKREKYESCDFMIDEAEQQVTKQENNDWWIKQITFRKEDTRNKRRGDTEMKST